METRAGWLVDLWPTCCHPPVKPWYAWICSSSVLSLPFSHGGKRPCCLSGASWNSALRTAITPVTPVHSVLGHSISFPYYVSVWVFLIGFWQVLLPTHPCPQAMLKVFSIREVRLFIFWNYYIKCQSYLAHLDDSKLRRSFTLARYRVFPLSILEKKVQKDPYTERLCWCGV